MHVLIISLAVAPMIIIWSFLIILIFTIDFILDQKIIREI